MVNVKQINNQKRNKYDIIDVIFVLLQPICMILSAIFLLNSLLAQVINIIIIIAFTVTTLYFWILRNPFYSYLAKAIGGSNFLFLFIKLPLFYHNLIVTQHYPLSKYGFLSLLILPSIIYFLITIRFSSLVLPGYRNVGARLAYLGYTKAAEDYIFRDNLEQRKKREDFIKSMKVKYNQKLVILLTCVFTLSYCITIFF